MTLKFFFERKSNFSGVMHSGIKICIFGTQLLLLQDTTVASLEHNCHIFGTQWTEEFDYNTVTVLIYNTLTVLI